MTGRLPGSVRLLLFLALSLTLSLVQRPVAIYAGAALLAALACRRGLSRALLRTLAWAILLPLPGFALLFLLSGREATGSWRQGAVWGLARLVPYAVRIASLLLANLLFIQATPLPELMGLLRSLPIPDQAALLLATLVRFLPTTLQEARRVLEAQRCRGLERRRLLTPSGLLALAVPLFLTQVRNAHDLALSLEIRGCASGPRPCKETP